VNQNLNDTIWKTMLVRHETGYDEPPFKSRDVPTGRKRRSPQEMRARGVVPGWHGDSKATLLAKGDMLPAEVRATFSSTWSHQTATSGPKDIGLQVARRHARSQRPYR